MSTREAFLGLQDALRKIRHFLGTTDPGAWAGVVVFIDSVLGVVVLISQEKWDCLKAICKYWLEVLKRGETALDYKKLLSDRGFLVYVMHAYPSLKPYLKGFHLSLGTWRGGRNSDGWKVHLNQTETDLEEEKATVLRGDDDSDDDSVQLQDNLMEELKMNLVVQASTGTLLSKSGPALGLTAAVPRFQSYLEALVHLTQS